MWCLDNPCRLIRRLPESRGRLRYLSDAELSTLLQTCRNDPHPYLYPAVLLALATGMRRGELFRLRWADVTNGVIYVEQTKNKQRRGLPLTSAAQEALMLLKERSMIHNISGRIFPDGGPRCGYYRLERPWRRAMKKAGIRDFKWHDLRHTCASYLAMAGVDLRTIGEILGHRTIQMTMRYSHLSREHLREAAESISGRLKK